MRGEKRLSARQVVTLGAGMHADGAGLYLQVTAAGTRSWIYRYQLQGRRREMGLGPAPLISLAAAREMAEAQRRLVATGTDPIDARRAGRATVGRTWGEAVDDFIVARKAEWKNSAQAEQWEQSLRDHGPSRDMLVVALDTPAVLAVLRKVWTTKTETATRIRGRIERIWSAERVAGHVSGENPARWRGHLDALLPRATKLRKVRNHPAMPYAELPAFWVRLCERDGIARRALRFAILTAARTSEVTRATWAEFDLEAKVWTRPPEHMKAAKEHAVPLSAEAIACLNGLPRTAPPFPLSENGMRALLQIDLQQPGVTVHGFRSTFRDWAGETTHHPREVIEHALAHLIKDKAEAAYARGTLLAKRRTLMEDWAAYCSSAPPTPRA